MRTLRDEFEPRRLVGAALMSLSILAVVACRDRGAGAGETGSTGDTTGGGNCGAAVCGLHEVCVVDADPPTCECEVAYVGEDCDQCAPGYEDPNGTGTCQPIVIDCDEQGICGLHGACTEQPPMPDTCVCDEGYAGPTCAQCATNWQDNDENGTCDPGCGAVELMCAPPLECDDSSGAAICGCPGNTEGDACQYCAEGFARVGDGPCYKVCQIDCVDPGACFDDFRREPASCRCPTGHEGVACDTCARGYAPNPNGRCTLVDIPASHTLLTHRVEAVTGAYFTLVNPDTGEWLDIGPLPGGTIAHPMAHDPQTGALYSYDFATPSGLYRLDPLTGTQEMLGPLGVTVEDLAWDPDRGTLVGSVDADTYDVYEWDVAAKSGVVHPTDATVPYIALAHRSGVDQLLALAKQGEPRLFAVDLAAGTRTELAVAGGLDASTQVGSLVVDPVTGRVFVVSWKQRTTEEIIGDRCRQAATRLGLDYADAPTTVHYLHDGSPAGGFRLESTTTGPEVVVYRSYDNDADPSNGLVQVATTNPEAFVCIVTYEELLEVHVEPGATWAGGVVYSYQASLTASVDPAWSESAPPLSVYASADSDGSFAAHPDAFALLDSRQWSDRVMPSLTDFESSSDMYPHRALVELDPDDFSAVNTIALDDALREVNYTAWRP